MLAASLRHTGRFEFKAVLKKNLHQSCKVKEMHWLYFNKTSIFLKTWEILYWTRTWSKSWQFAWDQWCLLAYEIFTFKKGTYVFCLSVTISVIIRKYIYLQFNSHSIHLQPIMELYECYIYLCWITHSESLFISISIQRITVFYWSPCSRGIPKQNPFFRFLLSGYLQDGVTLPSRNTVRNFGVIFDQYISFSAYNKHICRTAFLYLCNIWRRSTFKQSINHSLKMSLATKSKTRI